MNINGNILMDDLNDQITQIEKVKELMIEAEDWNALIALDAGVQTMKVIKRAIENGEYK